MVSRRHLLSLLVSAPIALISSGVDAKASDTFTYEVNVWRRKLEDGSVAQQTLLSWGEPHDIGDVYYGFKEIWSRPAWARSHEDLQYFPRLRLRTPIRGAHAVEWKVTSDEMAADEELLDRFEDAKHRDPFTIVYTPSDWQFTILTPVR